MRRAGDEYGGVSGRAIGQLFILRLVGRVSFNDGSVLSVVMGGTGYGRAPVFRR